MSLNPFPSLSSWNWCRIVLGFVCIMQVSVRRGVAENIATNERPPLAAAMIAVSDASPARLAELKSTGIDTVAFQLKQGDGAKRAIREAAAVVGESGLALAYWVEVARSPVLAEAHPEWMASLQTHDEWRRFFPDAPNPSASEVSKTYPWVPILSRESFAAQQTRVTALLQDLPVAKVVFLNDLQGAPSACGCGNPLCRWTSDYGKKRTTIPVSDDAAALFVSLIEKESPSSEVIPVWTTECEEHDGAPDGLCAGVGCYDGICWKAYTRQLVPVANTCDRIAVLATYKEFQRDLPRYGASEASWVEFAVKTFQTVPPQHNAQAIAASRIIAVVQGWDVTSAQIAAQKNAATRAGANGYVVAFDRIDQSWSPKVVKWK
ncbi:MAG: hypothetical protein ACE361_00110 [Aureliella sp.]